MWRNHVFRLSRRFVHVSNSWTSRSKFPSPHILSTPSITVTHRSFASDNGTSPQQKPTRSRRFADDVREYNEATRTGRIAQFDTSLIPVSKANIFPRIKTTSLSTKRIVIHDEAADSPLTLVMVAFRSFADDQLASWRFPFSEHFPEGKWFDVTVNESFGAQALSGFVQRWQRGRTDQTLHDYYVSFNDRAREPLETLLLSRNRMYGYVLLLDRKARVRFRGSGMANSHAIDVMVDCGQQLMKEDSVAE
ncbi:hypothetical protein BWQ96_03989 [Gracilariopsis chorda]|uniref:Uncharacterized protein n=1 Tax=Gracilariopsis chorda TaxID=448386 RepID=A0A2V3IW83_9FLOR|nr:hypothetical protein BWQ96_03989 [Gracilariopsis chorda]|eukprot:PXF46333.1 hypothetical protein BWQ96_03989 [Gracilariopsis chorda]